MKGSPLCCSSIADFFYIFESLHIEMRKQAGISELKRIENAGII